MKGIMHLRMKIHYLIVSIDNATGGNIYDSLLYEKLCHRFPGCVFLYDDLHFGDEFSEENILYKRFSKIYKRHADELFDCDYIIANSRVYTRFINFRWETYIQKYGTRLISIHHHYNYMSESGIKGIVHKVYENSFLRHMDCVITPNPYTLDVQKKMGIGPSSRMIDAYIDKTIVKEEEKKDRILFIGNIISRKGVNYATDAFIEFAKQNDSYEFDIVGKYENKDNYFITLKNKVNEAKLTNRIHFLGRVSDEEKEKLLNQDKVFLFPSLNEGYGWVMIEAMRHGLPVIAFNNTAMPYTVNDHNGILVKNRSVEELTNALILITSDVKKYKELSKGAIQYVDNLPNRSEIDKKYDKLFDDIENKKI